MLSIIFVKIQFHFEICSRYKNGEYRWTKQDWKIGTENDNENQKLIKKRVGTRNDRSGSKRTGSSIGRKNKKSKKKRQGGSESSRRNKEIKSQSIER